ncbi:MAG: exo-alpha-sialidase [Phycisphaerales bacterium]|nr:exo-alpha-sialidase [Phycisphaerales bacterium]
MRTSPRTALRRAGAALLLTLPALGSSALAQRGVQINTDALGNDIIGDAANEPTFAVSPVDPDRLVVGWRQFPTINSDSRYAGYAWSSDGGLTWTNGGTLAGPPGYQNPEQSDPLVKVNAQGVFYYWSEVFRPNYAQWMYQSADGGQTWSVPDPIEDPTSGDKPWLAIDNTGGMGDGHLYGGWNHFTLGGYCYVESTDGGHTWTPSKRIADAGGTQWMLHMVVGPEGEVYAGWKNYNQNAILITKSTNAKDPNVTTTFDAFGAGGRDGLDIRIDAANDPGNVPVNPTGFHQLFLGVDSSGGPRRGWVYALWPDDRRDGADLSFARSSDGGFTWETGIRVNDDGPGALQWMPAMSVAPNGRIDVFWFDTRNSSGHPVPWSQLFYTFSTDGGSNWAPNRRLSDAFDTTLGWPQQQKIGDYMESVSDDRGAGVVYPATFNGGQDLWFMRLEPFQVNVSALVAGQQGSASVAGARANESVWLAATLSGLGSTYVAQLNVTLSLDRPFQVGSMKTTDASGAAQWSLPVPRLAAGRTLWFQAVQRESTSNVAQAVVE